MKKLTNVMVAMFLVIAMLLTACGSSGQQKESKDAPKDAPKELKKIGIALTIGTPHANPAVIAEKKGWFKEEGLDPKISTFTSGPPMMEALSSGAWDVGVVAIPGWMGGAKAHNLHWVALGPWDENGVDIYARPDSDIVKAGKGNIQGFPEIYGKPENWKGKNILLPTGTTAHLTLISTLKAMGLTDKDVTITNMEVPSAFTAFKTKQGDAVGQWTLNSLSSQKEGWIRITSAPAVNVRIPIGVVASDKAVKENPELVKKYIKAYQKAVEWQKNNPEEASQIMYDFNMDNGFKATKEDCLALIKTRVYSTLEDQYKIFNKQGSDKESQMEKLVLVNFEFFKSMGRYKAEDWDKIGKLINPSILNSIKEGK